MSTARSKKLMSLQEEYKDLIGRPWTGRRIFGCYNIIRDYYRETRGRELAEFNARKVYSFTPEAIEEENGEWVYRSEWGDMVDYTDLQKDDILLFRLYTTALGGSYSAPKDRSPNHGGVYLGDGYMLHHPYDELSQLVDLYSKGFEIYQVAGVGAIRGKST